VSSAPSPSPAADSLPTRDGFDVLDVCHRQTVFALGRLAALVTRLQGQGVDAEARELAAEILHHFSVTAREHHADEERHVFPRLLAGNDPELVQVVLRLQQDHGWIEEDWMVLSAPIGAIANGHGGCDLDALREGAAVFTALAHDHIALEESIVYPQARARVPARERVAMAEEMAARRQARVARDEARSKLRSPT
jgi:iron-sulfur cluster repair protein YtfE (RIC family)